MCPFRLAHRFAAPSVLALLQEAQEHQLFEHRELEERPAAGQPLDLCHRDAQPLPRLTQSEP